MFEGNFCRGLSITHDQNLQRQMGTMQLEDFVDHYVTNAGTPAQLEALAYQFLCIGRRCKSSGLSDASARWKAAWRTTKALSDEAQVRLQTNPNRSTAPHLFRKQSVGRPRCLYSDLFLPNHFRLELAGLGFQTLPVGTYQPELMDQQIYRVIGSRDGRTWVKRISNDVTSEVRDPMMEGLMNLGRLIAVDEAIPERTL